MMCSPSRDGSAGVQGAAGPLSRGSGCPPSLLLYCAARCKPDPAIASGVFLTTFTDVLGFFFLLGLGTIFIDQLT